MTTNLTVSDWIIEKLIQLGVTQFVISPGSRSTPITVAAARNERAITQVHFDERGAAYFALGYGKATRVPAVLICTSGTAVANYFPAVVEASMDNIPLIVLSADRPPELIGVGANQAIFQENIYGDYPRYFKNMSPPDEHTKPDLILDNIEELYNAAIGKRPGPVHLNCQFREPLLPDNSAGLDSDRVVPKTTSTHGNAVPKFSISDDQFTELSTKFKAYSKGIIVVGRSVKPQDSRSILTFAESLNWPILPDIQSGLRLIKHPNIINYFDLLLLQKQTSLKPDLVLHFGSAFTSKRLLGFLNDPAIFYISIKATPETIDPNHQVNMCIQADIGPFCHQLSELNSTPANDWLQNWQHSNANTARIIQEHFKQETQISEPAISYEISRLIPADHTLMLANSMAIREMEMFAAIGHFNGVITANRGSSGIDGLFATAAGYQYGTQQALTLLIGDLAALHDMNSLALLSNINQTVIIILINNGGGGIFNFLPVREETDVFEPFFGTPHGFTFKKVSEMFGIAYKSPKTLGKFKQAYVDATREPRAAFIELTTDRYENHQRHQYFFSIIRGT